MIRFSKRNLLCVPKQQVFRLLHIFLISCLVLFMGCRLIQVAAGSFDEPLVPGKEYYFSESQLYGYYLSQTFHTKPLSPEKAEALDDIRIGVVRPDQKIDHERSYLRNRSSFPIDPSKFTTISDGTHFYSKSSTSSLEPISIDRAMHSEEYVKVVRHSGQIISSEIVSTSAMDARTYTYFPNGHFKKMSGYKRDGSVTTHFDLNFDQKTGQPIVPE